MQLPYLYGEMLARHVVDLLRFDFCLVLKVTTNRLVSMTHLLKLIVLHICVKSEVRLSWKEEGSNFVRRHVDGSHAEPTHHFDSSLLI